jgi:hypothetical protein
MTFLWEKQGYLSIHLSLKVWILGYVCVCKIFPFLSLPFFCPYLKIKPYKTNVKQFQANTHIQVKKYKFVMHTKSPTRCSIPVAATSLLSEVTAVLKVILIIFKHPLIMLQHWSLILQTKKGFWYICKVSFNLHISLSAFVFCTYHLLENLGYWTSRVSHSEFYPLQTQGLVHSILTGNL